MIRVQRQPQSVHHHHRHLLYPWHPHFSLHNHFSMKNHFFRRSQVLANFRSHFNCCFASLLSAQHDASTELLQNVGCFSSEWFNRRFQNDDLLRSRSPLICRIWKTATMAQRDVRCLLHLFLVSRRSCDRFVTCFCSIRTEYVRFSIDNQSCFFAFKFISNTRISQYN